MKKIITAGLSFAMAASMLAGCSSAPAEDADSGDKRVLKFDSFSGGNGEEVFTKLAEAFEAANPDVDVQLRFEKELPDVLNKENAQGEYSDVVYYNLGQPSGYTETQLNTNEVLDISDVIENINIDEEYANSRIVQYYGDGKSYLLPLKTTPAGFFYNTELIGEGKKYELPTTWDEFWALGDQAREDGIALFTYPTNGYFDNTLNALLKEAGGEEFLFNVLNYEPDVWNSEEGKTVIDIISKLVSPDYLYADTVSNANAKDGFTMNQQAVIDGKALFMPNGDWVVNEMADTTPEDFHWGLLPLPALEEGGERFVGSMTEQVWIPAQAKNVDDAKAFLEFIYSDEGVQIMAESGNIVPTTDMMDRVAAMEDGYTKEFFSVYNEATPAFGAFAPYNTENLPDFDRAVTVFGSIDSLATGEITADEYQSTLADAWVKLSENKLNAE